MQLKVYFLFPLLWYSLYASAVSDALAGYWMNEDNDAIVKFFLCKDGSYAGRVVWMAHPNDRNGKPLTDNHNPNPKLRSVPRVGLVSFKDVRYDEEQARWDLPWAYDPRFGMAGSGWIVVKGDEITLKAGKFGISKTVHLYRTCFDEKK